MAWDQLEDVLGLPKRHPACRWREPQLGSCTERENLTGDAKRKGACTYLAYRITLEGQGEDAFAKSLPSARAEIKW